jgi:hypothetical protein
MPQQPLVVHGLLIIEAVQSHSDTPHWVGSDERRERYLTTRNNQKIYIQNPAGFEPSIPASEELQTHAVDLATTGTGIS